MCGRYALHANPEVVALQFGLDRAPTFAARYNICPGTDLLGVRLDRHGARVATHYRWGLVPHWAKDPAMGNRLVNARGENLEEKPAFRDAFLRRRGLVPASGYYEWRSRRGAKQPWYLRPVDAPLFGLAGITASWHGPQGVMRSVSLITTAPNELTATIHDRMPLIVAPEDYAAWLDPKAEAPALRQLVRPYSAQRMSAYAVSPRVNAPENDDAALVEALPGGPAQRDLL
jgi:putative SOS response-associated peptidase YedK